MYLALVIWERTGRSGGFASDGRAAQNNIDKRIAEGILRETTGRQRNRVYAASRIIEIVESENMASDWHSWQGVRFSRPLSASCGRHILRFDLGYHRNQNV